MRRAGAAIASGGAPAGLQDACGYLKVAPCAGCVRHDQGTSSRSDRGLAFDFGSRSSKRKFELWHRFDPGKCLFYRLEIGWVPNGGGEQPQRKAGRQREILSFPPRPKVHSRPRKTAEFLGFSGPIIGQRDCPHRQCWRSERSCHRTLSSWFFNDLETTWIVVDVD